MEAHPGWGPCKYGAGCWRYDCPRQHPYDRPPPCPFGASCPQYGCMLNHPPHAGPTVGADGQPQRLCHFGQRCVNFKCAFVHPPLRPRPCPQGEGCPDTGCTMLHPKQRSANLCRWGAKCRMYHCERTHPAERANPCPQAGECTINGCTLLHPKTNTGGGMGHMGNPNMMSYSGHARPQFYNQPNMMYGMAPASGMPQYTATANMAQFSTGVHQAYSTPVDYSTFPPLANGQPRDPSAAASSYQ